MYNFLFDKKRSYGTKIAICIILPRICSYGTAFGFSNKIISTWIRYKGVPFLKRFYNSPRLTLMFHRNICPVEKIYNIFYVPLGTFGGSPGYNSPFSIISLAFKIAATLIESVICPFKTI